MSLRRKIFLKDSILLAGLVLLIAASVLGFWQQRRHVQASLNEYSALHRVEIAQTKLVAFEQAVHAGTMNDPSAKADLRASLAAMSEYKAVLGQYDSILPSEITPELQQVAKTKTKNIVSQLADLVRGTAPLDAAATNDSVDNILRQMADLLSTCNDFVHRTELESDRDLRTATVAVAAIASCMLLTAIAASSWQYRKVVVPLQRLRQWCRLAASGNFSVKYQPTSEIEFQELGQDVNKMAEELAGFYHKLEGMVSLKSRELVRSERLASVGYLAAGVAHEINNPLNIISGYAELSMKRLRRVDPDSVDGEVMKHLGIIRSEAFRCKEITQKLLSLAKGNGDIREVISLADAVTEVSKLVRGLKAFRGKKLEIELDPDEPMLVRANLTEIKQVLLNLIINAIEAVAQTSGRVTVHGLAVGGSVEVEVSDNGRGMTTETMERIFEPFFTNKRGAGEPGTGLGLSITHAIVTHHGGEIIAQSDGLKLGSRFIIRFPRVEAGETAPVPVQTIPIPEPVA